MIGALVLIPILLSVLSFVSGVVVDHKRMTFFGYASLLTLLTIGFVVIMVYAWVPLLQEYVNAN